MKMRVLITGGAGFIGSHLADELLERGYDVRVLASLVSQVHGPAIADRMAATLGTPIEPRLTGQYRIGDIRHCLADLGLARRVLGYQPRIDLAAGLRELAGWLATQTAVDRVEDMRAELAERGLAR